MTIREQLEQREQDLLAPQAAKSCRDAAGASSPRSRRIHPARVSARPRPRHSFESVPAPQAQDAGLLRADGRSLPHAAHAYARGLADRAQHREGPAAARGAHRGDRARPRPRPHAVRPRRRARAARAHAGRIQPLRAEPSHRRRPRERRTRLESDVGGPRRHRAPLERERAARRSAPTRPIARRRWRDRSRASPTSSPT